MSGQLLKPQGAESGDQTDRASYAQCSGNLMNGIDSGLALAIAALGISRYCMVMYEVNPTDLAAPLRYKIGTTSQRLVLSRTKLRITSAAAPSSVAATTTSR